ncbi:MFS transporter [Actinoplanes rectilineatus]|uniref:MFS transporter n=1 Tax=Actinoplanes rectilineatus TaxID=113571 RepID=UPI000ADA973C|nr:MFS transporter [Actinoplanes rectilineatus]
MPGLWKNADFRRLWAGQTASQLGEHTGLVLLPLIAVLTLHVGAEQLGMLRAVGQAPLLLVALTAGAWVDRWRARTIMVLSDSVRALVLGVVAVTALGGGLRLEFLLVTVFAVGALSVFFDVAYQASLVRLVTPEHLLRGNGAIEGTRSAAQMGGPALGGAMASALPAPVAAVVTGLMFLLSALALTRIRRPEQPVSSPGSARFRIRDGLRFVAGDRILRAVCLASGAFQFSHAALTTGILLFLPRELHLSGTLVGLTLAATGPGALVGSLLATRLPGRLGYGPVLIGGALIGNGVMLCLPLLPAGATATVVALPAVFAVFGMFGQLVNVTVMAVRQAVTPASLQGRAAATITFAGMGLTPFGALAGGFLADQMGLRVTVTLAAAGMMLSPLVMLVSPLARLGRTLPGPVPSR